MDAGD
jgi:hypothetical protein